jgi:hypothetical protein
MCVYALFVLIKLQMLIILYYVIEGRKKARGGSIFLRCFHINVSGFISSHALLDLNLKFIFYSEILKLKYNKKKLIP